VSSSAGFQPGPFALSNLKRSSSGLQIGVPWGIVLGLGKWGGLLAGSGTILNGEYNSSSVQDFKYFKNLEIFLFN